MVIASRLNRSIIPSPMSSPGDMTLMATFRSSELSWARNTAAMPPRPSSRPTSNSPAVARRSRWTTSTHGDSGSSYGSWSPFTMAVGCELSVSSSPQWEQKRSARRTVSPQFRQVRVDAIAPRSEVRKQLRI
jgi:hypothetical protein